MKVFITYKIPSVAEELLGKKGFEVSVHKGKKGISKTSLIKKVKDVDAVISLLSDKIDREVIDSMSNCKIIANYAVGYNNIEVNYAKEKGIIVTNTPGILTDATADLTLALILTAARRINEAERYVRNMKFDGWKPELFLGLDLKDKTVGIIGMGRIGYAVAKRCAAFGMKVIYYSKSVKQEAEKALKAKKVTLRKLLKTSDVVTLHIPLTDKTYRLLDREKLSLMKRNSILINTARGEVIEEEALIELLKRRHLFAAGFDVYDGEPNINKKLFTLDNVVLLPHIGSATIETRNAMAELAARNVVSVLKKGKAITPV